MSRVLTVVISVHVLQKMPRETSKLLHIFFSVTGSIILLETKTSLTPLGSCLDKIWIRQMSNPDS